MLGIPAAITENRANSGNVKNYVTQQVMAGNANEMREAITKHVQSGKLPGVTEVTDQTLIQSLNNSVDPNANPNETVHKIMDVNGARGEFMRVQKQDGSLKWYVKEAGALMLDDINRQEKLLENVGGVKGFNNIVLLADRIR